MARSIVVSVMDNWLALRYVTGCERPLKVTVDVVRNPVPFIVRVCEAAPAGSDSGDKEVTERAVLFGGGADELFPVLSPPQPATQIKTRRERANEVLQVMHASFKLARLSCILCGRNCSTWRLMFDPLRCIRLPTLRQTSRRETILRVLMPERSIEV